MNADTDRARDALRAIPPDCDRETWVKVGMSAQAAGVEPLALAQHHGHAGGGLQPV